MSGILFKLFKILELLTLTELTQLLNFKHILSFFLFVDKLFLLYPYSNVFEIRFNEVRLMKVW